MRQQWIEKGHPQLSMRAQCRLLQVNRNRTEPRAVKQTEEDLAICRVIDELHMDWPCLGSRRLVRQLRARGFAVGRKRVQRLMRQMGLRAVYAKPRTTIRRLDHKVYPYLLRNLVIDRPNQVWCTDITYIPMRKGFAFLTAIMDWHSRAVLAWKVSNSLDVSFCLEALRDAHRTAGCWPEIMNTDQGCQYTGSDWIKALTDAGIKISMDGKGRWMDNVFIERLWRSVKQEEIYLREYQTIPELEQGVARWMSFYNHQRHHQSLDYRTPWDVWSSAPCRQVA